LRGVNLASRNRIAMPQLREVLTRAGFDDVRTYVQSGNVVLATSASPDRVAEKVNRLIKETFAIEVPVQVRSQRELARVVGRNPLQKVAVDPKRYLVTFMSGELGNEVVQRMRAVAGPQEEFVVIGREVYSWHPEGVGRSPLWERLSGKVLGITATSRNWTTVSTLLAIADGSIPR
jgi:uncharacterized protein (DUF1697 family)